MGTQDDSSYNSEVESDPESDPDDPERQLNAWLGELNQLTMGLERRVTADATNNANAVGGSPLLTPAQEDCIDSYRFSMANLEETQDVDLDAILGELCALESQYDEAIAGAAQHKTNSGVDSSTGVMQHQQQQQLQHRRQQSETPAVIRTDSPDNDSAFSDSVSLLSSESSASSGRTDCLRPSQREVDGNGLSSSNGSGGKAEKIRLALAKMREANVKKLFVKAFSADGGSKSLLVDESMSCALVTRTLADKNHRTMHPRWALIEHLPELHMERAYEDHELLVDNLMIWTRDSKNKILFVERPERTVLFDKPEMFLGGGLRETAEDMDDYSRNNLLEEFFANPSVPNVEGPLYIKTDSRKGWKRHNCVLRASGLYYWPKEKTKSSKSDLVCLATFDVNQVYYGVSWKKKYRAPTEHCFGIKHPCLQQPKSAKHIKFLCADDALSLHRWVVGIRIAKYGQQLLLNYRSLVEECQLLAQGGEVRELTSPHLHRGSLAISLVGDTASSESGSSGCDVGFECEFPSSGTIKRKPPKLPLTATTRQLKEIGGGGLMTGATPPSLVNATSRSPSLTSRSPSVTSRSLGNSNSSAVVGVDFKSSFDSLPPPPPELLLFGGDDDDDREGCGIPDDDDDLPPPPPPPPPPRLAVAPPSAAFLQDLQRVMRRKWQVAQKCKQDLNTTPHEVLGFRDPPDYRETNVSNWLAEHYGQGQAHGQAKSLYENVYRPPAPVPPPPLIPASSGLVASAGGMTSSGLVISSLKQRRPPPPPPPRAETTQLTTTATTRQTSLSSLNHNNC